MAKAYYINSITYGPFIGTFEITLISMIMPRIFIFKKLLSIPFV